MSVPLETYEEAVLKRICGVCIDRRDDGSCGLDPDLECAVKEHLPEIVKMVRGVTSDRIDDYVTRLREKVCTICDRTEEDGSCGPRDRVDCALDRYLSVVVEAIEEVERGAQGSTA
ncbi:MAG: hypothetical protein PVF68_04865 [Acidobacteriota bacterium]